MSTDEKIESVAAVPSGVDDAVGVPGLKWFVAIVNSRHEKKVAERLTASGIETYVAIQKEWHLWKNGRRRRVDKVVIASMVFVRCTEKQRREIVTLPYINRFLTDRTAANGTLNRPIATIPDREIDRLRFILGQSDCPVDFIPTTFKVKDTVRVIRGSLLGLVGEIAEANDGTSTLTVILDCLGCARITIDPRDVELLT